MRDNNQSMSLHQNYMAQQEYLKALEEGFNFADVFINRPYLDHFNKAKILIPKHSYLFRPQDIRVFRVTKVVFDKAEDVSDKLISVYNALYNMSVTVGLFIKGSVYSVEFYFSTRAEEATLAGDILEASLLGNFPGIDLKNQMGKHYEELYSTLSPHAKLSYAYGENLPFMNTGSIDMM